MPLSEVMALCMKAVGRKDIKKIHCNFNTHKGDKHSLGSINIQALIAPKEWHHCISGLPEGDPRRATASSLQFWVARRASKPTRSLTE